ncbi:peptidyl-prolyl cis-trans isomerase [Helicobacter turcicus]|uniref:peptidylprolyl isomerase n=1 Tax=Helicobacter turcicus TaxID=2867412 RepID=A0ABS7JPH8_9HELI|nr:peptidyl-prolyl cis-trans isomerase [Helicobacter turcicus]MBX7491311.1 peptidylprolyl isomerase [Helicobacter turcicus]MBX7546202.1 peptidylprolyl isomerase [Helicobacter turcicus]
MKKILAGSVIVFALLQGVAFAKTYAKVNGSDVTDKDIAALMRAMPGVAFEQLPQEVKTQIVNQAIERKLLIEQAKKEKVQNSKEYKEAIANIEEELMLEVWMRKQINKVKVVESEITKFYDENKDKFVQPETIKVSHILVSSENEAKAIIAELKKAGKNVASKFDALAKEKSKDDSANNGGELGYIAKNQVVPEFANAAFGLKKGAYTTTPVKTQFGYHVILVEDKKPAGTIALKDIRGQIEQNLKLKKFQEEVKKEGEELRKKAKVELSK